uniref:Uncharacterized protein n=1 Tax=Glossina austeni TaxID=7395 RepID=A0A1A9VTN4_GLOAU
MKAFADRVKSRGFMITDHSSSTMTKMTRRHALMTSDLSDVFLIKDLFETFYPLTLLILASTTLLLQAEEYRIVLLIVYPLSDGRQSRRKLINHLLLLLFYVNFIHIWFSSFAAGIVMNSLIIP